IISAILLMFIGKQVAKAIFVDGHLLVPVVVLFVFMGSWLGAQSMGDLILMLSMGCLGLLMKRSGWPRPPLIIALVLGPNMENSLVISNRIYGNFGWLERTPSLIIAALVVLTIAVTAFGFVKRPRQPDVASLADGKFEAEHDIDNKISIEGGEKNPLISIPLAVFLIALYAAAGYIALDFHPANRLYPLYVSIASLFLLLIVLRNDIQDALKEKAVIGDWRTAWSRAYRKAGLDRSFKFVLWVAGAVFGCWLIGQKPAIALFMGLYLIIWGKRPKWLGLTYAVAGYLFIEIFYDQLMSLQFQPPLIGKLYGG
ncbi:MAG: tripartite tricarboxylate transporter permease, partial [Rhodospirillales bacterium]|nr:tripartite tricarboxylate transporter permease [Rhodospirillales bacterium]